MGGSGGMFGTSKQKSAGAFKMDSSAKLGEKEAVNRQRAIANGTAPSIAQMTFNGNIDQANNQAMALAASQRGASNPMLAFRNAQLMNQQNTMEASQQGAIMAEQERRSADDFLARQAAAQRGVSLQSAVANQQNDAAKSARDMKYGYEATAGVGQSMMEMVSDERAKEDISLKHGAADSLESFVKMTNTPKYQEEEPFPEKGGGGSSGLGKALFAMVSDKREKKDIQSKAGSGNEVEEFVNALKPYEYKYKDSKNGTGQKMGVMAQDLEKSDIGKTMVDQRPDGTKVVDTNKAIGAILASMADMNKKIKKLEK